MAKEIKFFITNFRNFHEIVNQPIRSKEDIIRILLLSLKNLLLDTPFKDEDKGEVIISIDKSSRIYFICKEPGKLPNKYYSFSFPFFLEQTSDNKLNVKCKVSLVDIHSEFIDYLLSLLDNKWFSDRNENSDNIDKFACDYLYTMDDYYSSKNIVDDVKDFHEKTNWSIIKTLLTFEPSYVRYDYDPDPKRLSDFHPLNHLDVHYDSTGTFKLGFDKSIKVQDRLDFDKFKDILENGKSLQNRCYMLK